jgi:hypothetical protein
VAADKQAYHGQQPLAVVLQRQAAWIILKLHQAQQAQQRMSGIS